MHTHPQHKSVRWTPLSTRIQLYGAIRNLGGALSIDAALDVVDVPQRFATFMGPTNFVKPTMSLTCVFREETAYPPHTTLLVGASKCPWTGPSEAKEEPDQVVYIDAPTRHKTLVLFPDEEYSSSSYMYTDPGPRIATEASHHLPLELFFPIKTEQILLVHDPLVVVMPSVQMALVDRAPLMRWSDPILCDLLVDPPESICVADHVTCAAACLILLLAWLLVAICSNICCAPPRSNATTVRTPLHPNKKKKRTTKKKVVSATMPYSSPDPIGPETDLVVCGDVECVPNGVPRADTHDLVCDLLDELMVLGDVHTTTLATLAKLQSTQATIDGSVCELTKIRSKIYDYAMALSQVHYYFSVDNLERDTFLHSLCNDDGFVDLGHVLNFPAMQKYHIESSELTELLRKSPIVTLNESGLSVRPRAPWGIIRCRTNAVGNGDISRRDPVDGKYSNVY